MEEPLFGRRWKATGSPPAAGDNKKVEGERPSVPSWYMTAGKPILIFEACPSGLLELPPDSVPVRWKGPSGDVGLAYHSLRGSAYRRTAGVWLLRSDPTADQKLVRHLRVHLFRLHAELETLSTLRDELQSGGRLTYDPDPRCQASQDLKRRLTKGIPLIEKSLRYGVEQESILECAQYAIGSRDSTLPALLDDLRQELATLELLGPSSVQGEQPDLLKPWPQAKTLLPPGASASHPPQV